MGQQGNAASEPEVGPPHSQFHFGYDAPVALHVSVFIFIALE